MKILISNDDGVYAPGIIALNRALVGAGHEVVVVAPDSERSGSGSAITITRPLRLSQVAGGFWAVNGTPADCVYLACNGGLSANFDLVISGINSGANLGDDVMYSGTVGAAREARHLSLPALAVSLCGSKVREYRNPEDYENCANWVSKFIESGLPDLGGDIININVPDGKILGAAVTRMGARLPANPVTQTHDPRGSEVFWIGLSGKELKTQPIHGLMSDFEAVEKGLVSVTPIKTDVTDYEQVHLLENHPVLTGWKLQVSNTQGEDD